ncbi:TerB family tellurite resistance protein [Motiliproteus sp. MSK22-1]|uniref:TerB family tellurite resistance protein n=1 Tax=Motiliproteus sp. MSK22-1 TaxID=1897630 RepID=UPI000975B1B6|nr:TerB family tellurite resistance protein [Motiliproteus sp. MSK22-1]OMH32082.1 hypothetical protein BGP75_15350 [Motiliproteus sp. MSK22-1]
MTDSTSSQWFDGIENIVTEPLKFKAKLNIGEDAYTSLRVKNKVFEAWDAAGVAVTAAAVAKSSTVASAFFAPTGMLAALGIGTAVTPIGWVIAAGVVGGGTWLGITRYIKNSSKDKVTVIPNFINTPLDVLALGLFDLLAPLSLKVADIDGKTDNAEREVIYKYFVDQWGYDPHFVEMGLEYTQSKLSEFSIREVAQTLANFKKTNPDCNYKSMSEEIVTFLTDVMEADGIIDKREEQAIARVRKIFEETGKTNLTATTKKTLASVARNTNRIISEGILGILKK